MIEDVPPIWYPYEAFYIEAMFFLTGSAMASADRLERVIARMEAGDETVDADGALNALQNILQQAGALSRYFWPTGAAYHDRGQYLREQFQLKDNSPLKTQVMRNRMEHFDEKLDDYLKDPVAGNIIPSYFGFEPPNNIVPHHIFRAYYSDTGTFEILGMKI